MPAGEKSKFEARQKGSDFHPCLRMEVGAFLHFRRQRKCNTFGHAGYGNRGDPMGTGCSRGTRSCLQGLVCYTFCDRRHGKGCCPAFGGIAYRAAGSGRDRPAHRQRPAAVRKRTERNLRAMPGKRFVKDRFIPQTRSLNDYLLQVFLIDRPRSANMAGIL